MRARALAGALIAASFALGVLAVPAQAARIRECGDAGTLYSGQVRLVNVTTRGVSCSYARSFARAITFRGGPVCDEDLHCRFRRWRCTNRARGGTLDRRCTKSNYVIRFQSR